jgi:hypothetical protein
MERSLRRNNAVGKQAQKKMREDEQDEIPNEIAITRVVK